MPGREVLENFRRQPARFRPEQERIIFVVARFVKARGAARCDREEAPAGMTETSFLASDGTPLPFDEARVGGLNVGVPGTVSGWETALNRYGTRQLSSLLRPAERIARRGFTIDATFNGQVTANGASVRVLSMAGSAPVSRPMCPIMLIRPLDAEAMRNPPPASESRSIE